MTKIVDRMLYPRTVAEMLNVHVNTVYRMVKGGRLPAIRIGTHLRISESAVKAFCLRREKPRRLGKKKTGITERQIVGRVVTFLKQTGSMIEYEKATEFGNIDIFVHCDPPLIIEVKRDKSLSKIHSAVGQLLFYRQDYPGARLLLITPGDVDPRVKRILKKFGIESVAEKNLANINKRSH